MAAAPRAAADTSDRVPRRLDQDLWVIDRPLRVYGLQIGCRMTVVRLTDGSLFLHSLLVVPYRGLVHLPLGLLREGQNHE